MMYICYVVISSRRLVYCELIIDQEGLNIGKNVHYELAVDNCQINGNVRELTYKHERKDMPLLAVKENSDK